MLRRTLRSTTRPGRDVEVQDATQIQNEVDMPAESEPPVPTSPATTALSATGTTPKGTPPSNRARGPVIPEETCPRKVDRRRFGQREARPPSLRKSRSASVGAMAAARS